MTVYKRGRALRDWLISTPEAARAIYVTENRIRTLSREGFIKPSARKGFYRLGDVLDGYAEAVRMGAVSTPHARGTAQAHFSCLGGGGWGMISLSGALWANAAIL